MTNRKIKIEKDKDSVYDWKYITNYQFKIVTSARNNNNNMSLLI